MMCTEYTHYIQGERHDLHTVPSGKFLACDEVIRQSSYTVSITGHYNAWAIKFVVGRLTIQVFDFLSVIISVPFSSDAYQMDPCICSVFKYQRTTASATCRCIIQQCSNACHESRSECCYKTLQWLIPYQLLVFICAYNGHISPLICHLYVFLYGTCT